MTTPRPLLNVPYGAYLSREVPAPDEELTRVGPGTPCGEYLRRFWQPVVFARELGAVPLAIRIMGEELVVFRDLRQRVGLLCVGSEGAIRGWWSGALDRALAPTFALTVRRRGHLEPETIPIERSGEVFELHDEVARTATAFQARRPLVRGVEARKRVIVCVEAERSLREGREIPLSF
jgi:hypothetical protein